MNENLLQVEDFEKFSRLIELTQTFMGKAYTDGVVKVQFDALSIAFIEIQTDLIFMSERRRGSSASLSEAKIAGCICFRLHKHHVFQFQDSDLVKSAQNTCYTAIPPILFALRWVYNDSIKKLKGGTGSVLSELRYLIAHRHANQEVLGLAFLALEKEQAVVLPS